MVGPVLLLVAMVHLVYDQNRYKCFEAFDGSIKRILQTDQLKNALKCLQHRIDYIPLVFLHHENTLVFLLYHGCIQKHHPSVSMYLIF